MKDYIYLRRYPNEKEGSLLHRLDNLFKELNKETFDYHPLLIKQVYQFAKQVVCEVEEIDFNEYHKRVENHKIDFLSQSYLPKIESEYSEYIKRSIGRFEDGLQQLALSVPHDKSLFCEIVNRGLSEIRASLLDDVKSKRLNISPEAETCYLPYKSLYYHCISLSLDLFPLGVTENYKLIRKEQESIVKPKNNKLTKKDFRSYLHHKNKEALMKKLHELIGGKKGKVVATVIIALEELGLIAGYESRTVLYKSMKNEFGDIGSNSGLNDFITNKHKIPDEDYARYKDILVSIK